MENIPYIDIFIEFTPILMSFSIGLRLAWCWLFRPLGLWHPAWFRYWLWFPWRFVAAILLSYWRWFEEVFRLGQRATGGWAGIIAILIMVYRPGQIYLGRLRLCGFTGYQPIGINGPRHFAMVAGAGAGKTTLLMTILGLWRGNRLVIDPKGQISRSIGAAPGQQLAILDPDGLIEGVASDCWNYFDILAWVEDVWGLDKVVKFAMKASAALITQDNHHQPFWAEVSRNFLTGLILFVYVTQPKEKRNLLTVRQFLMQGYGGVDGFKYLLQDMISHDAFDGAIANRASEIARYDPEEVGKYLSSAQQQTGWLDLPSIRAISQYSTFNLADLKQGHLDLRLSASVGSIRGELSSWVRLMIVTALDLFEAIPGKMKDPCLFAIDEMPSIGAIAGLAAAAPVMRSYGVRLLVITQDIELLRKTYPKEWGGFLGNAEAVWWMGTNHSETAQHLSKTLGCHCLAAGQEGRSDQERPLMDTDQIQLFLDPDRHNMIITRFGKRPMMLKNGPFFEELPVWLYQPDPDFTESPLRRFGRYLCCKYTGLKIDSNISDTAIPPTSHYSLTNIIDLIPQIITILGITSLITLIFAEIISGA